MQREWSMKEGCHRVLDASGRLLGYALFVDGEAQVFQPNRLTGSQLNKVFTALREGDLDGYRFRKVGATQYERETIDWHALTVRDPNRRQAWLKSRGRTSSD